MVDNRPIIVYNAQLMINNLILSLSIMIHSTNQAHLSLPYAQPGETIIASRAMSLDDRYPAKSVSDVFKDNILLNVAYLDGRVTNAKDVNWGSLEQPFKSEFTLQPKQTFAFHDAVLPEFQGKIALTTNAHFNSQDGFKTDGYLFGDGVCHLASLINWAARDANLQVEAPTNHNFAVIPEVPKQYGVAIYYDPNNQSAGARENLYITNNKDKPVNFVFEYKDGYLSVSVTTAA